MRFSAKKICRQHKNVNKKEMKNERNKETEYIQKRILKHVIYAVNECIVCTK